MKKKFFLKASSQSGFGNTNSVYCGGFLNDNNDATTDAKIKGIINIDLEFFFLKLIGILLLLYSRLHIPFCC